MAGRDLPQTQVILRVSARSIHSGCLHGEAEGGTYCWTFVWQFRGGGRLDIHPSMGRALIKEPLQRFLEKNDYRLESGENYAFVVRARI